MVAVSCILDGVITVAPNAGVDMFVKVTGIELDQQNAPVGIMAFNSGRIATVMQSLIRDASVDDFPIVHDLDSQGLSTF